MGADGSSEESHAASATPASARMVRRNANSDNEKSPNLAQDSAVSVIDEPTIESRNAEFDIVSKGSREALSFLDHVPDIALATVRQESGRAAITPRNRPIFTIRKVAVFMHLSKFRNRHVGQMRDVAHLMAEPRADPRQNTSVFASAG